MKREESPVEPVEDGWSGLTDPVERRRRQNRVNQRAYRQRRKAQKAGLDVHPKAIVSSIPTPPTSDSGSGSPETAIVPRNQSPSQSCFATDKALDFLHRFSEAAYQSYMLGCPTSDHLLTLSKVNVFRAFVQNITILGMDASPDWMHDDSLSPFSTPHPAFIESTNLPENLRPTPLQRKISHHPWLDFFPLPRMRDNLLKAGDSFDDEDLCLDIMDFWNRAMGGCSLLVWGDPANPDNWEVTEEFLRKWTWVVRGCPELMVSTNHWRRQRGEKMIFRYL